MAWALAAGGLRAAAGASTTLVSRVSDSASHPHLPPPLKRRIKSSPPKKKQPSVAEVQRAIGVAEDPLRTPSGGNSSSLDLLASTPIGQAEGPAEKKLREAAEWMVDRTEAHARAGQQILLVVCLKILPVWLILLLVASGVVKLPFNIPLMDDLIS